MTTNSQIRDKIKIFRPTSQKINLFEPNLKEKVSCFYKIKDADSNKFKLFVFRSLLLIETKIETSLLFTINYPDVICLANKKLKVIPNIGNIYTDNSNNETINNCLEKIKSELKPLQLQSNEGLMVYRNSIQLIVNQNRQIVPEICIIKNIKLIIEEYFPETVKEDCFSDLPEEFSQLISKYQNLTVTDDFERSEKIAKLSTRKKKEIISVMEPRLMQIDILLKTYENKPLPLDIIKLQILAEITLELKNYS